MALTREQRERLRLRISRVRLPVAQGQVSSTAELETYFDDLIREIDRAFAVGDGNVREAERFHVSVSEWIRYLDAERASPGSGTRPDFYPDERDPAIA